VRLLRQFTCLAVISAGMTALTATTPANADRGEDPGAHASLVQQLKDNATGTVRIHNERATGQAGFVRVGQGGDLLPGNGEKPAAKADAFMDEYAGVFGAPRGQLVRQEVTANRYGTTVTYTQEYKGLPVWGAMLRANLDTDGDLTSVNGEIVPALDLSVTPRLDKGEAAERAVRLVRAMPPGGDDGEVDTSGLQAVDNDLVVYREGLVRGVQGPSELVYEVEVTNRANIRDVVFVSAETGKAVNRYSMVDNALDREFYEANAKTGKARLVWSEGDRFPGNLNPDQQSMILSTGEAYWFFDNAFDRDSYDGQGHTMSTINNDPRIECPNANWNGITTNYCDGVSSDDVVAHEWGHAYTEYTHGLVYQWQPGALNESYSDIWGETIDLINNRLDEGEGDLTKHRSDLCSTHSPALPLLSINAPSSIAKDCLTGGASFGAQPTPEGVTGDVAAPTDAVEEGGTATDGCSSYEQDVSGKIVLVDRGLCTFVEKAQMAKAEGAAALIIGNRDDAPIGMSGDDTTLPTTVSIGLTDRESIRTAIKAGETVNVTIKDAGGDREDSFRWLIGEKSPAFGGAIRDMWKPTCYGDPGKVSDAEYKCSTDDSGGVHGNSGVPNHGYALLVDGGTYNGVTVEGIGLTKAAHIYYQAMTAHQTPTSDFTDHADALEASCTELLGKPLTALSTAANDATVSEEVIGSEDCAQVSAMAAAVELRRAPTQCNFGPLLDKDTPNICGPGMAEDVVWSEDFEDGLDGWATAGSAVYPGGLTADWEADTTAPGDHAGTVAYGPAPDRGQCTEDAGDFSSHDTITSEPITVPADGVSPRLRFDQYVATESGVDGGNLKISVNGGDFTLVPTKAYTFNAPKAMTPAAAGNTNPLAAEDAFSGSDGGVVTGSWGQSQIDLGAAGVTPGDSIVLRFDVGRDGCGGLDGWYVDNVAVVTCVDAPAAPAVTEVTGVQNPAVSRFGTSPVVDVTVANTEGEAVPTGSVTLTNENDRQVGSGVLEAGKVSVRLSKRTSIGTHTMTAHYAPADETFQADDSGPITVTVRKARTSTRLVLKPSRVARGGRFVAKVFVTTTGVTPRGTVKLRWKGDTVAQGKLVAGQVRLVVRRAFPVGRDTLKAGYVGTSKFTSSYDTAVLRVVRG
jgi:Zn-dependent metalloprotease